MRKKYCIGECDYSRHFASHRGGSLEDIRVYRGYPYQRGYGIGSVFRRFGIPILKWLGGQVLRQGVDIGKDYFEKKISKEELIPRMKKGAKLVASAGLSKGATYLGTGRKRKYSKSPKRLKKRVYKRRKPRKTTRRKRKLLL